MEVNARHALQGRHAIEILNTIDRSSVCIDWMRKLSAASLSLPGSRALTARSDSEDKDQSELRGYRYLD